MDFAVALCGTMWRYLALSGEAKYGQKVKIIIILDFAVALCGTMWHYLALSGKATYGQKVKILIILDIAVAQFLQLLFICSACNVLQQNQI